MKEFQHSIKDEMGLHARPASMLAMEAQKYESTITARFNGKEADAKSVIGLMTLIVKAGDTITLSIEGADEEKAFEELISFCDANV